LPLPPPPRGSQIFFNKSREDVFGIDSALVLDQGCSNMSSKTAHSPHVEWRVPDQWGPNKEDKDVPGKLVAQFDL
jgi:hypothetical protein